MKKWFLDQYNKYKEWRVERLTAELGVKNSKAAGKLVKILGNDAIPILIEAIPKVHWVERRTIVKELMKIGKPVIEPLIGFFESGGTVGIYEDVVIFGAMKDKRMVPRLISILMMNKEEKLREVAANGLGFQRDVRAIPYLIDALDDPSDMVKAEAAGALGKIGGAALIPVLQSLIDGKGRGYIGGIIRDIGAKKITVGLVEVKELLKEFVRRQSIVERTKGKAAADAARYWRMINEGVRRGKKEEGLKGKVSEGRLKPPVGNKRLIRMRRMRNG